MDEKAAVIGLIDTHIAAMTESRSSFPSEEPNEQLAVVLVGVAGVNASMQSLRVRDEGLSLDIVKKVQE
jgi:hypothetical protein